MSTRTEDRPTTAESASGGIAQLLRIARTECRSAVSFVAASLDGEHFVAAYPGPDQLAPGADVVDDLVRRLRLDSGLARGRALLRTVRLDSASPSARPARVAVAAVPLSGVTGHPWGFVGVADPDVKAFGFAELQRLSPLARRVASYVAAREVLRRQIDAATEVAPDGAAASNAPNVASAPPAAAAAPERPTTELLLAPRALLDRTRRLLSAGAKAGSLVVVALDVSGAPWPADEIATAAARAVRMDLRFDDPVARLGETGLVAVVPLAPGAPGPEEVAARLTASVRTALGGAVAVRSAHVRADLGAPADAVDLVREVTAKLLRDGPGAPRAR